MIYKFALVIVMQTLAYSSSGSGVIINSSPGSVVIGSPTPTVSRVPMVDYDSCSRLRDLVASLSSSVVSATCDAVQDALVSGTPLSGGTAWPVK